MSQPVCVKDGRVEIEIVHMRGYRSRLVTDVLGAKTVNHNLNEIITFIPLSSHLIYNSLLKVTDSFSFSHYIRILLNMPNTHNFPSNGLCPALYVCSLSCVCLCLCV